MTDRKTSNNQREITTRKNDTNRTTFVRIDMALFDQALAELPGNAFKLWAWLMKNSNGFKVYISSRVVHTKLKISENTYLNAFNVLLEKGYIIRVSGEQYITTDNVLPKVHENTNNSETSEIEVLNISKHQKMMDQNINNCCSETSEIDGHNNILNTKKEKECKYNSFLSHSSNYLAIEHEKEISERFRELGINHPDEEAKRFCEHFKEPLRKPENAISSWANNPKTRDRDLVYDPTGGSSEL